MAERRTLDDVLGPRFSRAQVAHHFGKSEKWLRRLLPKVRGVTPIKAGSTTLFTTDDVRLIEAHLRCQSMSAENGKASGTRVARSMSAKRGSSSPSTAQDAVRALMRTPKPPRGTPKSARTSLTVVAGGRET